jgi:hypothetical protein
VGSWFLVALASFGSLRIGYHAGYPCGCLAHSALAAGIDDNFHILERRWVKVFWGNRINVDYIKICIYFL